jgi:5-methylthioadenosine/S-adenosylhomocysteine deaminase
MPASIVLGTAVTMDPEREVVRGAAIYVDEEGTIEAVQGSRQAPPSGYARARRVETKGLVFPGLVDLHNHLAYNTLPLWKAPKDLPYGTRYQWPRAATYGRDISNPAQAYAIAAGAAALRYAEVKAVVGGATSIQGSPATKPRVFPGWMLRNVEKERFEGVRHAWRQSVLPETPEKLAKYGKDMAKGAVLAYHLAEGTAKELRAELELLEDAGCLQHTLVGIHSTALTRADWSRWGAVGGTVVWSPFSNVWLYGDTTDVLGARKAGLRVCLGCDWSPSGTRNLLGELKVARLWSEEQLDDALDARTLCEMVTSNPGEVLAEVWKRPVGRLVPGALADLCVLRRRDADPYEALVTATEADVRLVMVGGRPAYGVPALVRAAGARNAETVRVGSLTRALVMRLPPELQPEDPLLAAEANLSWARGLAQLEAVRKNPAQAVRLAERAGSRGVRVELELDMPGPEGVEGARRLDDDELDTLVMPPLDGLVHDRAFFERLDEIAPEHARMLVALRDRF